MPEDNAVDRVTQDLRRAAVGAAPGDRLPSVRELMARHRASPVDRPARDRAPRRRGPRRAAARAAGTFVAAPAAAAPAADARPTSPGSRSRSAPRAVDDARARTSCCALPPAGRDRARPAATSTRELQPLARARRRARPRRAAARARGSAGRSRASSALRAWFAARGGRPLRAPTTCVICPGGQAALSTALRALAAPGEPVLVESPTYLGAIAAARAAGLRAGARPQRRATASGPTCSPTRSRAPARASSTASRCTPTRTARRWRPSGARPVLDARARRPARS